MQTQNQTAQSGATLVVLEGKRLRIYDLDTKTDWSLGRDSMSGSVQPDIPFESTLISLEHSWVRLIGGKWYYVENPDNSNGTLYNGAPIARPRPGHKTGVLLQNGDILRIENVNPLYANSQSVMMLYSAVPITGKWKTLDLTGTAVTIGRDPNCTIVESLPYIATKHAAITYQHGGYYLSDCGSPSGTFLNGKRITGAVLLHEKDCIGLVDRKYFFLGNRLLYVQRNYQKEQKVLNSTPTAQHPIILSADVKSKVVNISKVPLMKKEKELLRDIRLDIREGSLVAVLGTAGAGKSTLMGCLSGLDQSGVTGSVVYRGVDLIKNLDQIKYLIGNVPQEKVIRPELTPEKAFMESAELRLSADVTKEEREKRVSDTLELLSMTKVKDTLNSRLSGGEQTRVNVGIDLVADRDIYFLDEPEQGLSPNLRDELYVFLRKLAHSHGKTIIAIIHDVSCIDMFDQVIFLVKANGVGRLAFSGSPQEGSNSFGVPIGKAYALLEANPEKYVR